MSTREQAWQRWHAVEKRAKAGEMLVIDGGTGSEVEQLVGKEALNTVGWTSTMNLTHPEAVKAVHRKYLDAGANIIITNTYSTNRHILAAAGLESQTEENNSVAVRLCQEALEEFRAAGGAQDVLIAGSISIHAPGDEKAKLEGKVPWPAADVEVANYAEQARLLMDAGVDLLFIELVWNMKHGERVVEALASLPSSVPTFLGIAVFNDALCLEAHDVRQGTGFDITARHEEAQSEDAIPLVKAIPKLTENPNIVGINIMHTKEHLVGPCLEAVRDAGWNGVLGAYPDCGQWLRDSWVAEVEPCHLADNAEKWLAAGAHFLGGCCGYGPEHISALSGWVADKRTRAEPQAHL